MRDLRRRRTLAYAAGHGALHTTLLRGTSETCVSSAKVAAHSHLLLKLAHRVNNFRHLGLMATGGINTLWPDLHALHPL
jgi:uncharacterized membrane protein YhfC